MSATGDIKSTIKRNLLDLEYHISVGTISSYEVAKVAPVGLIEKLYAADYALQQEQDNKTSG